MPWARPEICVEPLGTQEPYDWWDEIKDELTDEQRDAIWDLLDQIALYVVVETEVVPDAKGGPATVIVAGVATTLPDASSTVTVKPDSTVPAVPVDG